MTSITMPPAVGGGFTLSDIQRHVGVTPDGKIGPNTLAAIASKLGMILVSGKKVSTLNDPSAFFAGIKSTTGPLDQLQVNSINAILEAAAHWRTSWVAYALATAWHESKFRPIGELGGKAYLHEMYDIEGKRPQKARELGNTTPGDGIKYAGRGFVQLTGKNNYRKAGEFISADLVDKPDMVLDYTLSAEILIWGMETGAFTGRSLADCLPNDLGNPIQFIKARRIINGSDKASQIAEYAADFQQDLWKGVWA